MRSDLVVVVGHGCDREKGILWRNDLVWGGGVNGKGDGVGEKEDTWNNDTGSLTCKDVIGLRFRHR